MIKTAVIMAAGMGIRFGHFTERIPKGFVPFKGKPMVIRSIETLISCGIERIIIGTLYNCREAIGDNDFLLLESDLVYEQRAISDLIACPFDDAMLITPVTKFQDQYYVEMNDRCELVACSTDRDALQPSGELVGIHKISNRFYQLLAEDYGRVAEEKLRLGYEYQLLDVSRRITPMYVLCLQGLLWYEIDDAADLAFAEKNVPID